jgi:hypothetical protein
MNFIHPAFCFQMIIRRGFQNQYQNTTLHRLIDGELFIITLKQTGLAEYERHIYL